MMFSSVSVEFRRGWNFAVNDQEKNDSSDIYSLAGLSELESVLRYICRIFRMKLFMNKAIEPVGLPGRQSS